MAECDCHRLIGKAGYCDKCGQERYPMDCCICNGKNPEIRKRIESENAELTEYLIKIRKKVGDA
jgi:hypothetical protein